MRYIIGLFIILIGLLGTVFYTAHNINKDLEIETSRILKRVNLGEFKITAYCTCPECCGIWSEQHESRINTDYVQTTASGTTPSPYLTAAADWSVIKPGSEIWIPNVGFFIIEDKGAFIKGNRVDILLETHEQAVNFGVQYIDVYLEDD